MTFAPVGYGDLLPAPHARLLALTEGTVGAFAMGFLWWSCWPIVSGGKLGSGAFTPRHLTALTSVRHTHAVCVAMLVGAAGALRAPERSCMKPSFLRLVLSIFPKSLLSSWVGRAVHAPLPPPVARRAVALFAHWYQINVAEAELPLEHYPTIGALFSRRLTPGARPIGAGPVHPADALITTSGSIDQDTLLQGKGHTYTLEELVPHPHVAGYFAQGSFLTYYLCPTDYHRVHAPVDGEVTWSCHIPGAFWPVNAWGVQQVPKLFCVNERVVTLLQTPQGPVAVVMIAAMHVGQITLAYDTRITTTRRGPRRTITATVYTPPLPLAKGAELGIFHMGSTVIVLFAPGVLPGDVRPLQGCRVTMGASLYTGFP